FHLHFSTLPYVRLPLTGMHEGDTNGVASFRCTEVRRVAARSPIVQQPEAGGDRNEPGIGAQGGKLGVEKGGGLRDLAQFVKPERLRLLARRRMLLRKNDIGKRKRRVQPSELGKRGQTRTTDEIGRQ